LRFDLVELRLFLHVAEAQNITHGAKRSNLALGSASARFAAWRSPSAPFLARGRRGVKLTLAINALSRTRGWAAKHSAFQSAASC